MRYSEQFMEHIEYAFHAFCKIVLRHEAINAWRDLKRKEAREISQIETYFKLATPISNGGLTLTPPGYFSGSARGGISQYHFYWLPPKEGSPTFFRPPACRSLPVPEYISKSFLRLHSLLSKHSILAPRNACLPILFGTPDACQKASAYSSLSDMT